MISDLWNSVLLAPDDASGAGDGGAPASEGAGGTTVADSASGGDSGDDFAGLMDEGLDSVVVPADPKAGTTEVGGAKAPLAATGAPASAKAPVPPTPPAPVVAATPPAPAPAPAPVPGQATIEQRIAQTDFSKVTPEEMIELVTDSMPVMEQHFAEQFFSLTQDEVDELTTSPEVVIPRLLGRALAQVSRMIPHQIQQYVPRMIASEAQQVVTRNAAKDQFFAAWPGLVGQEADVAQAVRNLIGMGIKDRATVIQKAGELVCITKGLDLAKSRSAQAGVQSPRPAATNGAHGAQPFVPAGTSTSAPAGGPDGDVDEWAGFGLP